VTERFVRIDSSFVEVDFSGKGEQERKPVYFVGEAKIRLDDGKDRIFQELEKKPKQSKGIKATEVVKILVTHFAIGAFSEKSQKKASSFRVTNGDSGCLTLPGSQKELSLLHWGLYFPPGPPEDLRARTVPSKIAR